LKSRAAAVAKIGSDWDQILFTSAIDRPVPLTEVPPRRSFDQLELAIDQWTAIAKLAS
jgi:hypothetical protein